MIYEEQRYENTIKKINYLIEQSVDYNVLLNKICLEISKTYDLEIVISYKKNTYFCNKSDIPKKTCSIIKISNNKLDDILIEFYNKSGICNLNDLFIGTLEAVFRLVLKSIIQSERDLKEKQILEVKNGLDKLSFSELTAIIKIFEEFQNDSGTIVASNIAQEHNLTRSSIVNAIRKLESAMVLESYSLGVKGTHIKIINKYFIKEIKKLM